jgi:hypothetical protein
MRGRQRRQRLCWIAFTLAVVATLVLPSSAAALCPNCLGQTDSLTPTLKLVGLFLVVPVLVFLVVVRAIWRAGALQSARPSPTARPPSGADGGEGGGGLETG